MVGCMAYIEGGGTIGPISIPIHQVKTAPTDVVELSLDRGRLGFDSMGADKLRDASKVLIRTA